MVGKLMLAKLGASILHMGFSMGCLYCFCYGVYLLPEQAIPETMVKAAIFYVT